MLAAQLPRKCRPVTRGSAVAPPERGHGARGIASTAWENDRVMGRATATALLAFSLASCDAPLVARDGTLVFPERGGGHGAAILTANGVEYRDRRDVPERVVAR